MPADRNGGFARVLTGRVEYEADGVTMLFSGRCGHVRQPVKIGSGQAQGAKRTDCSKQSPKDEAKYPARDGKVR